MLTRLTFVGKGIFNYLFEGVNFCNQVSQIMNMEYKESHEFWVSMKRWEIDIKDETFQLKQPIRIKQ